MLITEIQERIQTLYGLDAIPAITQFLISKEKIASLHLLDRPQVVLCQKAGEVELGVYLGETFGLKGEIGANDIQLYAVLVEEVSHFIYLFWNMTHSQKFSLLDVEVQGEIDKFLLLADQLGFSDDLVQRLFGKYLLRDNLPKEEVTRYQKAHVLGKHFIKRILQADLNRSEMINFLRVFYRKGSTERIKEMYKIRGRKV